MNEFEVVLDFENGWPSPEEIKAAFSNARAVKRLLVCALLPQEPEPQIELKEIIHKQAS